MKHWYEFPLLLTMKTVRVSDMPEKHKEMLRKAKDTAEKAIERISNTPPLKEELQQIKSRRRHE